MKLIAHFNCKPFEVITCVLTLAVIEEVNPSLKVIFMVLNYVRFVFLFCAWSMFFWAGLSDIIY